MESPFVILDFPPSPARPAGGSLLFAEPLAVLEAHSIADVAGVLGEADAHAQRGQHAVGFVAYEAAPAFDSALAAHPPDALPLAWFGVFRAPSPVTVAAPAGSASAYWSDRGRPADFSRAVETIRAAIARGDVYQVNHTVRLDVELGGAVDALYRRLLLAQGGGYGAHIHTGRHEIISASPELFFERDGDRIVTRPMKGTARRGRWLAEDDARAAELSASPKERAENVMIVDLIRNDLGRIAQPGTVEVTRMFDVERLPTVLQMTSTITARLRDGRSTGDVFGALFPCGSVTGAPKIAATRMIAALEPERRGVYCGAIGHVAPGNRATFSVAIRTLSIDHPSRRGEYGTGAGITWDSANDAEYDEVIAKAGILTADLPQFDFVETLRLERGTYARLERHLRRLEESATYFGVESPAAVRAAARRALEQYAAEAGAEADAEGDADAGAVAGAVAGAGTPQRVRVQVTFDGVASVTAEQYSAPASPPRVALATSPVKRNNRFLYHKTTHRAVYDFHRAAHPGAFDVLLWNEDRELTEFTIGNLVLELDGARYTPPRACGLLAGTFREELLERGEVAERVLRVDDLARASRLWLVNSLRGWTEVQRHEGHESRRGTRAG